MAEKKIKTRIQNKHDIEANWVQATNFIPLAGELIVYDIDDEHPYQRFKFGDGVVQADGTIVGTNVNDLDFVVPDWAQQSQKPSYTAKDVGALSNTGGTMTLGSLGGKLYFGDACGTPVISVDSAIPNLGIAADAVALAPVGASMQSNEITAIKSSSDGLAVRNVSDTAYKGIYAATPTPSSSDNQAATKKYVDSSVDGLATEAFVAAEIAKAQLAGEEVDLFGYATKDDIKDFITTESDPTVPAWAKAETKPAYTADEVGALSLAGGTVIGKVSFKPIEDIGDYYTLHISSTSGTVAGQMAVRNEIKGMVPIIRSTYYDSAITDSNTIAAAFLSPYLNEGDETILCTNGTETWFTDKNRGYHQLKVPNQPTLDSHATSKKYVDTGVLAAKNYTDTAINNISLSYNEATESITFSTGNEV